MIDFTVLRTSIYDWAVANIPNGMPAIYYYANAPRNSPVVPIDYITLYISQVTQIGWDWNQDPTDNTGIANYVGDREFVLQVQGYGGDPLTVLNNLRTSLQKQTVLDSLRANGIVFVSWFPINDITDLVDSRFEQRATMDVLFRMADKYTDNLGVINTVNILEQFYSPDQTLVYSETITIPPS